MFQIPVSARGSERINALQPIKKNNPHQQHQHHLEQQKSEGDGLMDDQLNPRSDFTPRLQSMTGGIGSSPSSLNHHQVHPMTLKKKKPNRVIEGHDDHSSHRLSGLLSRFLNRKSNPTSTPPGVISCNHHGTQIA